MSSGFSRLLEWWARWERHFAVVSMVGGFSFDLIIAKRPDSIWDNLLLLFYLCVSATCIVLLAVRTPRQTEALDEPKPQPLLLLLIMQFCFGGLASNLLVLYGKSGTPGGQLLFIVLLLGMLIGNEFLRTRYEQTRFNIAVWYLLLLTYCVIAVPTFLLHSVGPKEFLLSGALSVMVALVFLAILWWVTRLFRGKIGSRRLIESGAIIGIVFLFFTFLYFTQTIPPVPLSLKDIGIYHYVVRDASNAYEAQYEPAPWWEFWQETSSTFYAAPGDRAYCFSSVFAPEGLATPIRHVWQYYDLQSAQWQTRGDVTFSITGGRADGYRGFTIKSDLQPGTWRCDVETVQGQLIGREQFTVIATSTEPALSNVSL